MKLHFILRLTISRVQTPQEWSSHSEASPHPQVLLISVRGGNKFQNWEVELEISVLKTIEKLSYISSSQHQPSLAFPPLSFSLNHPFPKVFVERRRQIWGRKGWGPVFKWHNGGFQSGSEVSIVSPWNAEVLNPSWVNGLSQEKNPHYKPGTIYPAHKFQYW